MAAVTARHEGNCTQLALAQADLRAFGAETRTLAGDIRSGGDASGVLRSQLEQVAKPVQQHQIEVVSLTTAVGALCAPHEALVGLSSAAAGARRTRRHPRSRRCRRLCRGLCETADPRSGADSDLAFVTRAIGGEHSHQLRLLCGSITFTISSLFRQGTVPLKMRPSGG